MSEPTRTTAGALAPGDHFSLTKSGEVWTVVSMERHPRAVWINYERGRWTDHTGAERYGGCGRIRPQLHKDLWQHHPTTPSPEADR